jgi:hypothetical protein
MDRRQALVDLLSRPDSPDLHHRGNRITVEGRSDRYQMLPYLAASFVQAKLTELGEREQWREDNAPLPAPDASRTTGTQTFSFSLPPSAR